MSLPKILVIYNQRYEQYWSFDLNWGWIEDLNASGYDVRKWGLGYVNDVSQAGFNAVIDDFKPDFIYMSVKTVYDEWLFLSLNYGKEVKILVECDTQDYLRNDNFTTLFDKVYCRQPRWGAYCREQIPEMASCIINQKCINADSWKDTPLFRWSISERRIKYNVQNKQSGVAHVGRLNSYYYSYRRKFYNKFRYIVRFANHINNNYLSLEDYWKFLYGAEAVVCPAESNVGSLVQGKLFEAAAAGCAIITNCDLIDYDMADLNEVVCRYNNEEELREIIVSGAYKPFVNKAQDVIKNHIHTIRFKELFG